MLFILAGYGFGIMSKFIGNNITYVLPLYILNFVMVGTDIVLYFINSKRDALLLEEA